MSLIKATWTLYRDAAVATGKTLPRSGVALLFLVLASGAEVVLWTVFGGAGFGGGIIIGTIDAFLCAWYLALLRVLVVGNRRLVMSDIRDTMGQHFSEVIWISLGFSIIQLVLFNAYPMALPVFIPIVSLALNPTPEVVYQDGKPVLESLRGAFSFMGENWPEWLVAQLLITGSLTAALIGLNTVLSGPGSLPTAFEGLGLTASITMTVGSWFGPWFDFMTLGPALLGLVGTHALGLGLSAALFVIAHLVMLFRGHLYKRLSRSNRRGRAWQARM